MDINIRANASFGFDPDKRVEKSENIEYYLDYLNDDGTSVLEREKFSWNHCRSCGKFFTLDGGKAWYRKEHVLKFKFKPDKKTITIYFTRGEHSSIEETILFVANGSGIELLEHFVDVIGN